MKKIMMISEHASPVAPLGGVDSGGQNVYVRQLSEEAARRGMFVDVYTRRDDPAQADFVQAGDHVRVLHVPAGPAAPLPKEQLLPLIPEFARYCVALARQQNYDVVHAHYFMSGFVACELQRRLGLPFVITFHALGKVRRLHQAAADGFPDQRFAIEEQVVEQADGIIAECPQDAQDLVMLYAADPRKIFMIPCGVSPDTFYPELKTAAREFLGLPQEALMALHVGRLVPRKGVDNVIRALALLRGSDKEQPVILVIAGGETDQPDPQTCPEIARLSGIAQQLGVQDQVRFVGRKPPGTLRWYYSAADMFVTTPWYEPFGITPLEAMACGVPVIGSRVGGIKYTVQEGETGLLVPPRDPAALARAMRELFEQPALRAACSAAGIRRVRDLFTWSTVASSVFSAYRIVAGEREQAGAVGSSQWH